MLTRKLVPAQGLLRSCADGSCTVRRCRAALATPFADHRPHQRRELHHVPRLKDDNYMADNGIPGLLSADAFTIAWTNYQDMMMEELNRRTAGTPEQDLDIRSLIIRSARSPTTAALFNHASMAFNNHFFFKGIMSREPPSSPAPDPLYAAAESYQNPSASPERNTPASMSPHLESDLTTAFTSLPSLKATFLDTAASMFGPGFVWLVRLRHSSASSSRSYAYSRSPTTSSSGPEYRVLATYNAGSPLPGAHWRHQPADLNAHNPTTTPTPLPGSLPTPSTLLPQHLSPQNAVGAAGPHSSAHARLLAESRARPRAPGAADLTPVLCVNTWEHVWLRDWGIDGKRDFLEAWWERVDWAVVEELARAGEATVGGGGLYGASGYREKRGGAYNGYGFGAGGV